MLISLPKEIIDKTTEYGTPEDFEYLVSIAIQTKPPDTSAPSGPLEKIKINLSREDELTLKHRSAMLGETVDSLLAQLLQNYV